MGNPFQQQAVRLVTSSALVGALTATLLFTGIANHATVALAYLALILPVAAFWGLVEATAASILATLCFNYFFIPPTGTFTIAERENWIALSAFLVVSIAASQIAERVRRRGLDASAQFKSTLLDALAHELKTPLTSLKAAASALRGSRPAEAAQGELVSIIEEESDRLDRIISEILRMASADAGKLRVERKTWAAEPVLLQLAENARRNMPGRSTRVNVAAHLPDVVADPDLVQTVLRNLLENADKYSPRGRPIVLSAEKLGEHVCISVADEGPGLLDEELPHIFERAYRAPSTRKAAAGSGLGLAIARDIVAAHGGKIWAESVPGAGSKFSFTLPAAKGKDD